MTDDLTRIADALERNTNALQAILQRLAEPTLLPLIESTPDAEPEPEPKPTAAEVLEAAWQQAAEGSANGSILYAALCYAEAHPEWFADWGTRDWPVSVLLSAASEQAETAGDKTASWLLLAASGVAADHPHLFGGAAS